MITITEHDRKEWTRCARAMYGAGCTDAGHALSAAAAYPAQQMTPAHFDRVQGIYRRWLVFNTLPE